MGSLKIIRNVRTLCFDPAGTEFTEANILISGDQISDVGPALEFPTTHGDVEEINGTGKLAIPGLINGHFHSPANLMKGSLPGLPLEVFMLYEVPPLGDQPPPARLVYIRTLLGAIEMLKLGITSVQDDAFFVPFPDMPSINAVMEAYVDSGLRATVALDQPNVVEYEKYPYLDELLPQQMMQAMAQAPVPSSETLSDLYQTFIDKWHGAEDGRIGAAVSCSAPHRVTGDYLQFLSHLSHTHELPFYIHLLETKVQRVFGKQKLGQSLVQYLKQQNVLNKHVNLIHGIWIDDQDIKTIAEAGTLVAHNPICNLRLGSGIMPFRKIRDHHIPICIGTDEALADDSINLWNAVKLAGMIHNITDPDYRTWPTAKEILTCLFQGGARAMGKPNTIGAIAAGMQADITLLDLNHINFTPLNDVKRQLVYCENGASVCLTMVAGEVLMENGRLLKIDEEAVKREARALMTEQRSGLKKAAESAADLEPYYREMYLRAAAEDVGMNRWANGPDDQPVVKGTKTN